MIKEVTARIRAWARMVRPGQQEYHGKRGTNVSDWVDREIET